MALNPGVLARHSKIATLLRVGGSPEAHGFRILHKVSHCSMERKQNSHTAAVTISTISKLNDERGG